MNLSSEKNRAGIGRLWCPKVKSTSLILWISLATLEGALGQSNNRSRGNRANSRRTLSFAKQRAASNDWH